MDHGRATLQMMIPLGQQNRDSMIEMQWCAEGGADGAPAPGIQPGGHPTTEFCKKT